MRAPAAALLILALAAPAGASVHRFGRVSVEVDEASAFPGGLLAVTISSRQPLRGQFLAILDGRRCTAFWTGDGLRALVPVPVTYRPGPATLGIEVRTARGRQRLAIPLAIAPRSYPPRETVLPDAKRELVGLPGAVRDGRRLLQLLRTVTPRKEWRGPFRPPVAASPEPTFGAPMTYPGLSAVESRMDGIFGEYHRGLDYQVPEGTAVLAPAPGTVVFAGPLALSGRTVVIDHGLGVLSVLAHLAGTSVRDGEWIDAGAVVGTSGDSGIAPGPQLHWGVYVLGVAVDPRVF
jgi:murein DD-endopeptidase MepM/ murein hydrolase activator NlpD